MKKFVLTPAGKNVIFWGLATMGLMVVHALVENKFDEASFQCMFDEAYEKKIAEKKGAKDERK